MMNCSFIVHNYESDAEAVEDAIKSVVEEAVWSSSWASATMTRTPATRFSRISRN